MRSHPSGDRNSSDYGQELRVDGEVLVDALVWTTRPESGMVRTASIAQASSAPSPKMRVSHPLAGVHLSGDG